MSVDGNAGKVTPVVDEQGTRLHVGDMVFTDRRGLCEVGWFRHIVSPEGGCAPASSFPGGSW